jgi:hypothetical protein
MARHCCLGQGHRSVYPVLLEGLFSVEQRLSVSHHELCTLAARYL